MAGDGLGKGTCIGGRNIGRYDLCKARCSEICCIDVVYVKRRKQTSRIGGDPEFIDTLKVAVGGNIDPASPVSTVSKRRKGRDRKTGARHSNPGTVTPDGKVGIGAAHVIAQVNRVQVKQLSVVCFEPHRGNGSSTGVQAEVNKTAIRYSAPVFTGYHVIIGSAGVAANIPARVLNVVGCEACASI